MLAGVVRCDARGGELVVYFHRRDVGAASVLIRGAGPVSVPPLPPGQLKHIPPSPAAPVCSSAHSSADLGGVMWVRSVSRPRASAGCRCRRRPGSVRSWPPLFVCRRRARSHRAASRALRSVNGDGSGLFIQRHRQRSRRVGRVRCRRRRCSAGRPPCCCVGDEAGRPAQRLPPAPARPT